MKKQLNIKNYPIELNHVNSLNFKGLQVADLFLVNIPGLRK